MVRLQAPLTISTRLLPALQVGDGWISLDGIGWNPADDRHTCRFVFDLPSGASVDDQLQMPDFGLDRDERTRAAFESLLSFLSAAAESYAANMDFSGENADLFAEPIVEWAYQNSEEISMLAYELEEA